MRVFGTKQVEPNHEDRAAIARLNALAARFKPQQDTAPVELAEEPPEQIAN